MQTWCPFAARKPLGPQIEPGIGVPRIFIIHTMSGYLGGTDSMFRSRGYSGTESHFGIGGEFDGSNDGAIWQWQDLSHGADAQFAGNAYATSVETSDGAHDGVRWSAKQAESIIRLGVWWCQQTGHPARLVTSPDQAGFSYHAAFGVWNRNAHDCPGSVRLRQYKTEIIPAIAQRLAGKDVEPSTTVPVGQTYDADFGKENYPASFVWIGAFAEAKRAKAAANEAAAKVDALTAKVDAMASAIDAITAAVVPPRPR